MDCKDHLLPNPLTWAGNLPLDLVVCWIADKRLHFTKNETNQTRCPEYQNNKSFFFFFFLAISNYWTPVAPFHALQLTSELTVILQCHG